MLLIKNGRITHFEIGRPSHDGRLLYAFEDSQGVVWFYAADGRSAYYENGKMQLVDPAIVYQELVLRANRMWVPGQSGGFWAMQNGLVQKWNNNQKERDFGASPWKINTIVTSACEDRDGNLIVGTLGAGVFWYEPDGKFRQISKAQGLSSDFVLSLCLDHGGNLWVGTDGGGLDRIKRKIFNSPAEFHALAAQSIAEDGHGGLWTAFNAHGVSYLLTNSVAGL